MAVLLGDQPGVTSALIDRVAAAFLAGETAAVRPVWQRGARHAASPVTRSFIARRIWPALRELEGDQGARELFATIRRGCASSRSKASRPPTSTTRPTTRALSMHWRWRRREAEHGDRHPGDVPGCAPRSTRSGDSCWIPRQVATCMPGAELDEVVDERTFLGNVKVKVGAITTRYKGRVQLTLVDEPGHRIQMVGRGTGDERRHRQGLDVEHAAHARRRADRGGGGGERRSHRSHHAGRPRHDSGRLAPALPAIRRRAPSGISSPRRRRRRPDPRLRPGRRPRRPSPTSRRSGSCRSSSRCCGRRSCASSAACSGGSRRERVTRRSWGRSWS